MKSLRRRMTRQLTLSSVLVACLCLFVVEFAPLAQVTLINNFMVFVALAITLDLVVGELGLFPAGHAAFFGAGAYVSVILEQRAQWPIIPSVLVSIGVASALAAIIGLPAVYRTAGMHFAIVSFAFGELLILLVNEQPNYTYGSNGILVSWGSGAKLPWGQSIERYFSVWIAVVLLIVLVVAVIVRNSQLGLRLRIIHESEPIAKALGFNPTWYKTGMFVIVSALAALVGCVYAPAVGFIDPSIMNVQTTILLFGFVVIGGVRTLWGPVVGVGLLMTLPQLLGLGSTAQVVLVGCVMVVVIILRPGGIMSLVKDGWRWAARQRQRSRPVADVRSSATFAVDKPDPAPAEAE
jgi:branched-chain amino acid transport system permease protein